MASKTRLAHWSDVAHRSHDLCLSGTWTGLRFREEGGMDEGMRPLIIKRAWSAADRQHVCQIAWTVEQLQRIEQAIEDGDETFLATVEEAIRRALDTALAPQRGR
jgi:hypothetical protein